MRSSILPRSCKRVNNQAAVEGVVLPRVETMVAEVIADEARVAVDDEDVAVVEELIYWKRDQSWMPACCNIPTSPVGRTIVTLGEWCHVHMHSRGSDTVGRIEDDTNRSLLVERF
jgi:hypothetical protein